MVHLGKLVFSCFLGGHPSLSWQAKDQDGHRHSTKLWFLKGRARTWFIPHRPVREGVSTDSLKFHVGPPCPTLIRPAGEPPPKRPYGRLGGVPLTGRVACGRLLPPWILLPARAWIPDNIIRLVLESLRRLCNTLLRGLKWIAFFFLFDHFVIGWTRDC